MGRKRKIRTVSIKQNNNIMKYFCICRLSYSYEGTDAGQTTDALIDMTGEFFFYEIIKIRIFVVIRRNRRII